jgi:hypothetical protein
MKNYKEYKFKEGFTIKQSRKPDGVIFAMGETHVCENNVFDLYHDDKLIDTYETYETAKEKGMKITLA